MVLYKGVFFENYYKHPKYSLRSLFKAALFIFVSGGQWRMLPQDFPKWQTVYWHFRKWRNEGHLQHCIEKLVMKIRHQRKQNPSPTVMYLDTQSTKWDNRLSYNGYDANKKEGIKHTFCVERNGFILGRTISSTGIHDSHLVPHICEQVSDVWPTFRKGLVDIGYQDHLANEIKQYFIIDLTLFAETKLKKDLSNMATWLFHVIPLFP